MRSIFTAIIAIIAIDLIRVGIDQYIDTRVEIKVRDILDKTSA